MAFDSSLLVEEESGFDPSLLVDDEPDSRSTKRERLKAEMVEARKVPISQRLLETAGALGDYVVDPISKMNPLTAIPRAAFGAGQVAGIVPAEQPFPLDEDKPLVDLQQALVNPVVEAGSLVDELRYGAQQAAADVGQFFVTPRGISALASGGAPAAARGALAAGFAGSMAAAVPEAYEATKQAFEGDSTSDKARASLNLAATVAAPVAIGAGALRQGLKPAERLVAETPVTERIQDASQIRQAEEVHGDVREVAQEIPQEVPAKVSGERIPSSTGPAVQGEVLLAPEASTIPNARLVLDRPVQEPYSDKFSVSLQVAATDFPGGIKEQIKSSLPEDLTSKLDEISLLSGEIVPTNKQLSVPGRVQLTFKDKASAQAAIDYFKGHKEPAPAPVLSESMQLAKQYEGNPAELERLKTDAEKAAADAQSDYKSKTGPEKEAAFEKWQEAAQRPQAYTEALQLLKDNAAGSVGPGAASPKEFMQRERREPTGSTPVGLPSEAKPSIEIARANKDYNLFNNINSSQWAFYFGKLGESAKSAIERIFTGEFRMRESINKDTRVYVERTLSSLPRPLRKQGGKAFFDVVNGRKMEEILSEWEGKPGGDKVIEASEQLKTRLEEVRTTIRDTKRESYNAYLKSLDKPALDDLFSKNMGENVDVSRFDKAQMADALTLSSLPDDWGIADGTYLPHLFFGNYKVTAGEGAFVTRAKTLAEAKAKIYQLSKNNPELANASFKVEQDTVVPADMIRLGDKNFWRMVGQMKESLGVSAAEIKEAQSGIIGRKASKQKWFGSLQERQGFEGYSKDFKQVMTAYLNGFHRWKELSAMQRDVQPLIETVRSEGRPNAANRLDEIMENLWGKPAKSTVEFDAFVRQIPGVRNWIKPLALDRWSRNARSLASLLTLRTVRFATVNRLQPLQGLYPVVGERLLVKGKAFQHSAEGKALLDEGGVSFDVGQYAEPGARGKLSDLGERFSGEKSNQELAFLSMFLHGQEQGMGKAQAIQYAKLRGQLMTQFTPLISDIPKALSGPFGQLAFQFKRFPIKQAELAAQLVHERNFGGITRMLGVFAVMGGASFYMRQLMLDKEKQLRMRRALESELGKKGADVAMYGLPGLVGADLSGSLVLGDEPFGENIYEKAGRQLAGPAVSLAYETGKNILRTSRQPVTVMEKTKAVIRRIPSLKPLAELADLESGNTDVMTPDGEVKYRRALSDAIAGLGSFRSASEANRQLAINGIIELKKETQALKNDVFVSLNSDPSKALDAVKAFNTRWPEAAITADELTGYLKRRQTGSVKTDEERTAGRKLRPLLDTK